MSICKDCICKKYCGDDDIWRCDRYFRDDSIKKELTNEEWLHTLPIEERADEIIGYIGNAIGLARYYNDDDVAEFVAWLKAVHRDGH